MTSHLTRRRRLPAAIAVVILAATSLATIAAAASAATRPHQVNKLAHVSLSPTQGSRVGTAQSFHIVNYHSRLCLGIAGDKNDQVAVQWGCINHADQIWHWGSQNSSHPGFYQLVNGNNSCLGIAGGSRAEGARAVGWTCYGSAHLDQYWAPLPYTCSGYVPLENLGSGYVMGVAGNSTAQGAPVVQWRYQGVCNNQFWYGA